MDTELFELCKEVCERTGWKTNEAAFRNGKREWIDDHDYVPTATAFDIESAPLYTSDYLLEKLNDYIGRFLLVPKSGNEWALFADNIDVFYADTPLKALLKLTIALYDAKEPNK